MKKFKVLRDCWGFRGRKWIKDTVVEFENDVFPPRHFELVSNTEKTTASSQKSQHERSFSEMSKTSKVESGFAHESTLMKPFEEKTASQKLKKQKGKKR